jgi:DNA-binding response OmpR family regulator
MPKETSRNAPHVLVVEDQEVIQELLITVFEHENIPLVCKGTVAEGIEALDQEPDTIILDLHLPDGRGTDVFREIRRRGMSARVAVATGTIDQNLIGQAKDMGPDLLLQKPYRINDLIAWVRQAVEPATVLA